MAFVLVYITHPSTADAEKVLDVLFERKLIACANIFPIKSAYIWMGAREDADEVVTLVKTTEERWDALKAAVLEIHPYTVPCVMRLDACANDGYEAWIREVVP